MMQAALDTPQKKALAAGAGLFALAALWSLWRGGPLGAVVLLPVFYPFLVGHLPWLIVLPLLGVLGAMGWASWRARGRHKAAKVVLGYLVLAAALLLWGRVCESAKLNWVEWHMGGAGLQAGMTRTDVENAIRRRAALESCTPGGCTYGPRGLAKRAFAIFELYGVNTEYGADGRLERWQTWSD
jgi:hypothetical protein